MLGSTKNGHTIYVSGISSRCRFKSPPTILFRGESNWEHSIPPGRNVSPEQHSHMYVYIDGARDIWGWNYMC